jgi:Holliday junction resolvase-like predicted endonuclease
MAKKHFIIKASGEKEPFNIKKFKESLRRAGASSKTIQKLIKKIQRRKPKTTQLLHEFTTNLLKEEAPPLADRYNVKRALMELGPDGYPFEKYIAHLLTMQGYNTQTNQVIKGACIDHEIDVIAQKDNHHYMVEAKFHNSPGLKSNVKVTLYIQARFEDVSTYWQQKTRKDNAIHIPWLITNTKFTSQAIQYGECKKMKLLAWNYPKHNNLAQMIEQYNLFPITTLTSLNKKQKKTFLQKGLVLCSQVESQQKLLKSMKFSDQKIKKLLQEANAVCKL